MEGYFRSDDLVSGMSYYFNACGGVANELQCDGTLVTDPIAYQVDPTRVPQPEPPHFPIGTCSAMGSTPTQVS